MGEQDRFSMRLFTGIPLTREARRHVKDIQTALSEAVSGVRWVPADNFHVTLKFFGTAERADVPSLVELMEKNAGLLPEEVWVGGAGGFASDRSARVLWAGVRDDTGGLAELYGRLDRGGAKLGFPREKRGYRPHVTVGRARHQVSIPPECLERLSDCARMEVGSVALFESVLRQAGAEYSVIADVPRESGRRGG